MASVDDLHGLFAGGLTFRDLDQCPALRAEVRDAALRWGIPVSDEVAALAAVVNQVIATAENTQSCDPVERDKAEEVLGGAALAGLLESSSPSIMSRYRRAAGLMHRGERTVRKPEHVAAALAAVATRVTALLDDEAAFKAVVSVDTPEPVREPVVSDVLRRVRAMSERLAEDINVVTAGTVESAGRTLADGLYVERTCQHHRGDGRQSVFSAIIATDGPRRVLVHGEAGDGKSTLLWALHRDLCDLPHIEPILVSSAWLMAIDRRNPSRGRLVGTEEILEAVAQIRADGRSPVVLLDTADLLLHSDEDRLTALALCDELDALDAKVVIACRSREAALLPRDGRVEFGLRPYDNAELADAVAKYVGAFCPDAPPDDPDAKVRLITDAVARGLPVQEVCRSPLRMRMLFELYAPKFPLLEIDVSGLYDRYRDHKVVTDRRIDTGLDHGPDLSDTAEQCAIALLAMGRPELPDTVLTMYASRIAKTWEPPTSSRAAIADAIDKLIARGVLLQHPDGVTRFNHQTLFEYFAASGLLRRDGPGAHDRLVEWLDEHPADLFVGAVLEQLLILLGRDPLAQPSTTAAVARLLADDHVSVQSIGLVVLAHHPHLAPPGKRLFQDRAPEIVRRFAQVAPTVRQTRPAELFAQLAEIWNTEAPLTRQAVLEALERLTGQFPAQVVGFLRDHDCVGYLITQQRDVLLTNRVLPRILAAIADADPRFAADELLRMLVEACAVSSGRDMAVFLLRLLAERWPVLGSGTLSTRVREVVASAQAAHGDRDSKSVRGGYGRLLAQIWRAEALPADPAIWDEHVNTICEALEANDQDPITGAELIGVLYSLEPLPTGDPLITATIDRLLHLNPPSAPWQLGRGALAALLHDDSPASAYVAKRISELLEELPAPGNKPPPGPKMWAAVARNTLNNAKLSPDQLATVLRPCRATAAVNLWLHPQGLTQLLVPAAVGGHITARRALDKLSARPSLLEPTSRKLVGHAIRPYLSRDPSLLDLVLALASADQSATDLIQTIKALGTTLTREFEHRLAGIRSLFDGLMNAGGARQREGVNLLAALENIGVHTDLPLDEAVRYLDRSVDSHARGNWLNLMVTWALRGAAPITEVHRHVADLVAISGDPPTLGSPGGNVDLLRAAREALLRTVVHTADLDDDTTVEALRLASATPTDAAVFALLGFRISRMVSSGRIRAAADLLVRTSQAAGQALATANPQDSLANKLRKPTRELFRHADNELRREILASVTKVHPTLGRIMVNSAAREAFDDCEADLRTMAGQPLPPAVTTQIDTDLRIRLRAVGTSPLPQLLYRAGEEEDYPGIYRKPGGKNH